MFVAAHASLARSLAQMLTAISPINHSHGELAIESRLLDVDRIRGGGALQRLRLECVRSSDSRSDWIQACEVRQSIQTGDRWLAIDRSVGAVGLMQKSEAEEEARQSLQTRLW